MDKKLLNTVIGQIPYLLLLSMLQDALELQPDKKKLFET
jgi:hypothetical protein